MIFFDAHIHLYPDHNRDRLCDTFATHARRLAPEAGEWAMAVMLRQGQGRLAQLLAATDRPGQRWQLVDTPQDGVATLSDGNRAIKLFAARQIATAERIELLGLFCETELPDGLPTAGTLQQLQAAGALPLLAWGLGKWLLGRAAVVDALLTAADPTNFLIGDSALRPTFWGEPRPMRQARSRGIRIVCGSDPLPRRNDETVAGRYATLLDGSIDSATPAASLRRLLLDPAVTLAAAGRRQGIIGTLQRLR